MVVPTSPVVPGKNDHSVRPIRAVANGVHDRRYPGWPAPRVAESVIRILASGNHPAHLRKLIVCDVGEYLGIALVLVDHNLRVRAGIIRSDTGGGIGRRSVRSAHVLNRVGGSPDGARRGRVIA